ncbi:T9SS type A sorting domain-containing protein [bacterium SCSIO 12643]|nr:T9SS type A sorting domain-containing protein [bacterium SCSIO 12643]
MRKILLRKKNFLTIAAMLTLFFVSATITVNGQFVNSTVPPLNGGNGSGGSTFNLTVTAPIIVTEIGQAFQSSTQPYEIWYSTTPISGPPTISAANGWTMIQSGTVTGQSIGLTPVVSSLTLNTPLVLGPGTYGFYVGGASSSVVYTTYNSSNQSTFTDAFTTIETGPGVGYGGSIPNPTFSTRQFNGSVTYVPASTSPDNVSLSSIETPGVYCAGGFDSISVKVSNFGTNQVDSFMVVWDVNSVMDSAWFIAPLDTFGGTGATDTIVTLDTLTMPAGATNITVWTKWPNGVQDTDTSNDTASGVFEPALNGTYTIGTGGDYTTFTDAVNAMDAYGLCGPTVFEVLSNTYVEQIELGSYTGMSSTNNVTFRSQAGDADSVILSYAATGSADNYVVNFNGASYFTFEDITMENLGSTYLRVLTTPTSGGSHDNTINNCIIKASTTTSTSTLRSLTYIYGADNDNWTITNNQFINGSYGIYFYGNFSNYNKNTVIANNECIDQRYRGIHFYYQEDAIFDNNYVASTSTYTSGYAMYLSGHSRTQITNNHIDGTNVWPRYGMYMINLTGDLNTFMPVVNNRVVMPRPNASRGVYASNWLFVEFAHNSVYMNSTSNFSPALYFTGGSFNSVKNNILINGGTGSAMYISGSGVYEMDYNNLSAPNGGVIGYNGSAQATLTDWVAATGFDSNSVNVNNVMSDTATFKVCNDSLYGVGMYMPAYSMDFEGDMRQDPPCIGADEFMPISEFGFNDNPVLCDGDTLTLQQDYFDTVVWNTTDTSNTYDITAPGTQQVAVYDQCGSDTSVFDVLAQQVAVVGDTNLCEGTSATLNTGISGGTYMWSNDLNSDTSTDSVVVVDTAMTVYVEVVDMHGCSSMDTAIVTQSFDVVLDDSASFCEGANVVLDANMQGTYLWSDGSTNQTLSVTSPGSYSVTVTDQNCVSSASTNVTEILDAVAAFSDSSSFYTVAFTNTSQNGTSYLWDFGDGTTSTDENPVHVYPWTNEDSICYVVTLTVTNSCGSHTYTNDCVRVGVMVSVSEVELASLISVYPNPNAGIFTVNVKSDEAKDMSVQVLDIRGAQVFVQSYGKVNGEVNRTINLEGAAQGIYFVKVTLDGETAVYRVSVK